MQVEHNNADLVLRETCLFVWWVVSFPSKAIGSQSSQGTLKALGNLLAVLFVLLDNLHHLSWPSAALHFPSPPPSSSSTEELNENSVFLLLLIFFLCCLFSVTGVLIFSLLCRSLGLKHSVFA